MADGDLLKKAQKLATIIIAKGDENIIVYESLEGYHEINIDDFLKQPLEGMLYDLNRDLPSCITNIRNGTHGWINNYAMAKIMGKMYGQIQEANSEIDRLKQQIETYKDNKNHERMATVTA